MYLKQIKINGFKSFADKIDLDLKDGITGIVGPNGSGKSNIVDAVRWVLGEQSVKSLRGDANMTDVIFAGSKNRNSLNKASVTLVFDNTDHTLNINFNEVSIKRVIYKTGENEYYINNEKVRLKDISDLLIDSGSAKESFSIISQGDIANVLSAKAEDRRYIIESAAGVLKYKKRKIEAVKKLERTNDNIDRINDIIKELETNLEPLKKQSIDAKKYIDTKKELDSIEISLIVNDIDLTNELYNKNKSLIEEVNKEILNMDTSTNKYDAVLSKNNLELSKYNEQLFKKQKELLEVTSLVEKLDGKRNIINERKNYEVDDIKLRNNILFLKEEQLKINNKLDLISNEIDNLIVDNNRNSLKLEEYNNEINSIIKEITKLDQDCNDKNNNILSNNYKISILNDSIESNSKYPYSVKSVLNSKLTGICNTIGNVIDIPSIYSTAIDVALGSSSSFIITETNKDAVNAISYLKNNSLGRATFFPIDIIKGKTIDNTSLELLKDKEGYINIASKLVKYDNKYNDIIENQLGNIVVVKDMNSLNNISRLLNYRYRVVSLDGDVSHVGGSLTGGIIKNSSSVIMDKMELDKLTKENIKLKSDLELISNTISNKKEAYNILNSKYNELNKRIIYSTEIMNSKKLEKEELNNKLDTIINNIKSTDSVLNNSISKEEENIINEYYDKLKYKEKINLDISNISNKIREIEDEINSINHEIKTINSSYYKKQNELKELEVSIGKMEVKLDNLLSVLNEKYSLTYDKAKKDYFLSIDKDDAIKKINEYKIIINNIGIVNIGAIEEYERVNTRYEFLVNQKNDLFKAENTLNEIIKEMDTVMTSLFIDTFKKIEIEFKNVFKELFGGGDAYLKLVDENDILNTGIEIQAIPPGKKLTSISLLSGGEKALTAISLLFAILRVRPVPFCILDEVEAPLDEANVDIFGKFVKKIEDKTQFIIITHKKRTMEYANVLYGITMQESGVSKLVSVRLDDIK